MDKTVETNVFLILFNFSTLTQTWKTLKANAIPFKTVGTLQMHAEWQIYKSVIKFIKLCILG